MNQSSVGLKNDELRFSCKFGPQSPIFIWFPNEQLSLRSTDMTTRNKLPTNEKITPLLTVYLEVFNVFSSKAVVT